MDTKEASLRAIKDRIAGVLGEIDDAASNVFNKQNHLRLSKAAKELHKCADEMQNMLMRIHLK